MVEGGVGVMFFQVVRKKKKSCTCWLSACCVSLKCSLKPFNVFLRRYNLQYLLHTYRQTHAHTHMYTTPGNLYLSHSISNLRQTEQNCFFFFLNLPPPLNRGVATLIQVVTCTKNTQEVFCLRQPLLEFLVTHRLVQTSRQERPSSFDCQVVCLKKKKPETRVQVGRYESFVSK